MSGDLFARVAPRAAPAKPAPRPSQDHRCVVCGELAGFGFDVFLRRGREGRWACLAHRDEVEAMVQ